MVHADGMQGLKHEETLRDIFMVLGVLMKKNLVFSHFLTVCNYFFKPVCENRSNKFDFVVLQYSFSQLSTDPNNNSNLES